MAPEVGRVAWHHGHVADADGDLLVAARAEVGLARLVGLDGADLDVVVGRCQRGSSAHNRSRATTTKAATTNT
jgi:hypothetical protein